MKKLLAILLLFVSSIGFAQHQYTKSVTASGTGTYTATIVVPSFPPSYANTILYLKFSNTNAGAATINVNSVGAAAIRAWDGDSWEVLTGGEIDVNTVYKLSYSGSFFELESFGSGGGSANTGELENVTETGTTYSVTDADAGKMIHFTNASGVTVTLPNTLTADRIFNFTRDEGAGIITFVGSGGAVLNAPALTLEVPSVDYPVVCSWSKVDATRFDGFGQLGSASAALTDGEGTTANGSAADLGGAVTTTRTFTGTGNWNWGSDATPYDGFLNLKALYTGGTGGLSSVVRTNTTLYSQVLQYSDQLSLSVRDATSGSSNTSILFDGSANGLLQLKANNRLLIQTSSNNHFISLDDDEGIGMKLGSDATNDMYRRNSSGFLERIPIGSVNDVLTNVAGTIAWAAPSGGGGSGTVNSGTAGQIAYYAGSGTAVSGATTGTGVVTALGVNTGSAGAFVVNGGALGTPSSGTGTNITGIPYANLTGTAPFWLTTGTTTATGAMTLVGSSSNTFKMNFPSLGTTATDGAGIWKSNGTAAALGAQQYAPSDVDEAQIWNSGTSASHSVKLRKWLTGTQGNPVVGIYSFNFNINGAGYAATAPVVFSTGPITQVVTSGGTTSATGPLRLDDSGGVTLWEFLSDGGIRGGNGGSRPTFGSSAGTSAFSKTGASWTFNSPGGNTYQHFFRASSAAAPNVIGVDADLAWSSGTNNSYFIRGDDASINITSTGGGDIGFIRWNPTVTATTATTNLYFAQVASGFRTGLGTLAPTATLHLGAGTTTASSAPLKFTEGSNPTTPEDGILNYVSNNLTFTETSTVYTLEKTLTGNGTIDFGSVGAQGELTSNITVTGAADGDKVVVGWTNSAESAGLIYTARVSATNTVTVKASNITLVPIDPGSGTFKVSVIKD
jgi:hypothetical protein